MLNFKSTARKIGEIDITSTDVKSVAKTTTRITAKTTGIGVGATAGIVAVSALMGPGIIAGVAGLAVGSGVYKLVNRKKKVEPDEAG